MTDNTKTENKLAVELLQITPDAEKVIEQAGRTCYLSFENIGANSQTEFIERLMKMGHESPLEHALATFRITGCSRAMTHQLVRHRLLAISQQSQRYVSEDAFHYVTPPSIGEEFVDDYHSDMETIRQMYQKWRERGIKREDARFVLPNACTSEMVISANFREFRHIFSVRLSHKAQWEIRDACKKMLAILKAEAPACFGDINADS